jgi:hypothetical protein
LLTLQLVDCGSLSDTTIQTPITVIASRVSKIKLQNRRQRTTTIDNSPSRRSQTHQQAETANHHNGFTTVEMLQMVCEHDVASSALWNN